MVLSIEFFFNQRLIRWKSKAFSYQLVLLSFALLFEQCLFVYLTWLIHPKEIAVPSGTSESISILVLTLRNAKERSTVHELLGGYLTVSQCDGATVLHFSKGYLKLSPMAFKTHCNEREKSLKQKGKEPKHPLLFARRESFSCNYIDFYVWLWRFTQSFTSRVACLLPQRDQLRTQSSPHLWAFKMPSDALTCTEAPWSLNCGIANSRKLYISTNVLFWHNKSCVLIHMFL